VSQDSWDIYLAALLHDVGKVGQRAFASKEEGLSEQSKRMMEHICPQAKEGYSTHLHVLYTNEFYNNIESNLPDAFSKSNVAKLATAHHKPSSEEEELIAQADRLSSAIERIGEPVNERDFRNLPLVPITSQVLIGESNNNNNSYTHVLQEINDDYNVFMPKNNNNKLMGQYKTLWNQLIKKWKRNSNCKPLMYLCQAQTDMERFTWSVPSATNVTPSVVSLYDHSRTVAAIAGCLCRTEEQAKPFILVSGDYSGIQRYLYDFKRKEGDEPEKGFAKQLRARSFKVRLFTEHLVQYILKQTNSPNVHRIFSAGGRLYLLLPNTELTNTCLIKLHQDINEWSVKFSSGNLRYNLCWNAISEKEIKNFSKQLIILNEQLGEEGAHSLKTYLQDNNWNTSGFVCQEGTINNDEVISNDKSLGKRLPGSRGIALQTLTKPKLEDGLPFADIGLITDEYHQHEAELVYSWDLPSSDDHKCVIRSHIALHTPTVDDRDDLLTFEELAERAAGRSVLGYIKADVDNLGLIFGIGLGKQASISHIASLSRSLECFFGDYVNYLIKTRFPLIYLIYSGGDDLAAVGPWDQALEFIIKLREEFDRYVCQNKSWGLSAGVYISSPKTHILDAMDQAEELLEQAKRCKGKDRLTYWGASLAWSEAQKSIKLGRQIAEWIQNDDLHTSQVRRLLHYSNLHEKYRDTNNTGYLRYIPLLKYDLTRNWKSSPAQAAWAQQLINPAHPEHAYLKQSLVYALTAVRSKSGE
jgi:CRISPR-associated protein Csm1